MVRVCPDGTVPSAHGNGVLQAPVVETKLRPVGVTSATETPAASEGPLLVTVIVYARVWPGVTDAGPFMERVISACPEFTGVDARPELFAATGSPVDALTVAAFTIGFAPA